MTKGTNFQKIHESSPTENVEEHFLPRFVAVSKGCDLAMARKKKAAPRVGAATECSVMHKVP